MQSDDSEPARVEVAVVGGGPAGLTAAIALAAAGVKTALISPPDPRPDNRTGWMSGETPAVIDELLESEPPRGADIGVRLWDPSTQLRFRAKRVVPERPDGAPNTVPVG